jgi:galactonate dehydratase
MRITKLETFLANAGLRNYLFIRLHTDTGLTGIGESTLEWQEKTVETLIREFLAERYVVGANPCDIEDLVSRMVRDQYQGGTTIMTAISGIEIALWDILGKDCGKPVYQLLGGVATKTFRPMPTDGTAELEHRKSTPKEQNKWSAWGIAL